MTSWLLPSKSSERVCFPFGPSKTYSFGTASQGSSRRCLLKSSRSRVNSFSFKRSAALAESHSSCPTMRWFSILTLAARESGWYSLLLSSLFISLLLGLSKSCFRQYEVIRPGLRAVFRTRPPSAFWLTKRAASVRHASDRLVGQDACASRWLRRSWFRGRPAAGE